MECSSSGRHTETLDCLVRPSHSSARLLLKHALYCTAALCKMHLVQYKVCDICFELLLFRLNCFLAALPKQRQARIQIHRWPYVCVEYAKQEAGVNMEGTAHTF